MARKRHSDEDILRLLRQIELKLSEGNDVQSACRRVGIIDATLYNCRTRFAQAKTASIRPRGQLAVSVFSVQIGTSTPASFRTPGKQHLEKRLTIVERQVSEQPCLAGLEPSAADYYLCALCR